MLQSAVARVAVDTRKVTTADLWFRDHDAKKVHRRSGWDGFRIPEVGFFEKTLVGKSGWDPL